MGPAAGKHVAWEQQHRQTVDRGERRAGDHVGGARAHRAGARERAQPVTRTGKAGGDVDHRLLVAALVVADLRGVLLERLADARDVAVAEDAKAPFDEALLASVTLDVLR